MSLLALIFIIIDKSDSIKDRSISSYGGLEVFVTKKNQSEFFLLSHREIRPKNDLYIVGNISNISPYKIEDAVIYVSYYDEDNKLLDHARNYIGDLNTADNKDFRVSLKCCSQEDRQDFSKYKRYELSVKDAYYRTKSSLD